MHQRVPRTWKDINWDEIGITSFNLHGFSHWSGTGQCEKHVIFAKSIWNVNLHYCAKQAFFSPRFSYRLSPHRHFHRSYQLSHAAESVSVLCRLVMFISLVLNHPSAQQWAVMSHFNTALGVLQKLQNTKRTQVQMEVSTCNMLQPVTKKLLAFILALV